MGYNIINILNYYAVHVHDFYYVYALFVRSCIWVSFCSSCCICILTVYSMCKCYVYMLCVYAVFVFRRWSTEAARECGCITHSLALAPLVQVLWIVPVRRIAAVATTVAVKEKNRKATGSTALSSGTAGLYTLYSSRCTVPTQCIYRTNVC